MTIGAETKGIGDTVALPCGPEISVRPRERTDKNVCATGWLPTPEPGPISQFCLLPLLKIILPCRLPARTSQSAGTVPAG
jgi:hypothetical protein